MRITLFISVCFFLFYRSFACDTSEHQYSPEQTTKLDLALDDHTSLLSDLGLLIEAKADPRIKSTKWRRTVLYRAVHENYAPLCRVALDHGADVNQKLFIFGETPAMSTSSSEVLAVLIEKRADVHKKDSDGKTPLHHQASSLLVSTGDTIALLCGAGASPNVQDAGGNTPLHLACDDFLGFRYSKVAALVLAGALSVPNKQGRLPRDCVSSRAVAEFDDTVIVTTDYLGIAWRDCKADIARRLKKDKPEHKQKKRVYGHCPMTLVDMPYIFMDGSAFFRGDLKD